MKASIRQQVLDLDDQFVEDASAIKRKINCPSR